jgi:hypothetical protein
LFSAPARKRSLVSGSVVTAWPGRRHGGYRLHTTSRIE